MSHEIKTPFERHCSSQFSLLLQLIAESTMRGKQLWKDVHGICTRHHNGHLPFSALRRSIAIVTNFRHFWSFENWIRNYRIHHRPAASVNIHEKYTTPAIFLGAGLLSRAWNNFSLGEPRRRSRAVPGRKSDWNGQELQRWSPSIWSASK